MNKGANLNSKELLNLLTYVIKNNQLIQEQGNTPVAIKIMGEAGIGKTSVVLEAGELNNLPVEKINLAQLEDVSDLVGYPSQEFQMYIEKEVEVPVDPTDPSKGKVKKTGKKIAWVDKKLIDEFSKKGFKVTGQSRMSYSLPKFLQGKKDGGILLLDDFNRANPKFQQAIMELIDRQSYISFNLPKNWHIILTGNPDDGSYLVSTEDDAQNTRMLSVNLKFDMTGWAEWAEKKKINGRCINFMLLYPEVITKEVNARIATKFFLTLESFSDYDKNLPMIQMLAESSVGVEFGSLFTTFIKHKMDKFVSPKEIMLNKDTSVLKSLEEIVKDKDGSYRSDLASMMAMRIANFILVYVENNRITDSFIKRMEKILVEDYFNDDLKYFIVRKLYKGNPNKLSRLFYSPEVMKFMTK